ncbi:hypothetical protein [Desulfosediminicola sp.]|uniref:hypothetical protein n=1 Tax=Desulfosediminicola sp. TaxID=2886825 RepID=UPI003AF2D30C
MIVHHLGEILVERIVDQVAVGVCHDIPAVLLGLDAVTGGTVGRADDHVDSVAVVLEGVAVLLYPEAVTLVAAHHHPLKLVRDVGGRDAALQIRFGQPLGRRHPAVPAGLPGRNQPRMELGVAAQAIFGFIAELEVLAIEIQTDQTDKNSCDELDHAFHHFLLMLQPPDSGSDPHDTTFHHAETWHTYFITRCLPTLE